ncbi:prenyltransferase/squalene oxidase repeat-containing protein [Enterococcus massiliensis]|uniref:hypothetical protein n=1 Tax=Enterococcus massiliensis TaxID=1640685 RepID=UPI00065E7AF3|nr:hypothetical protein [Enterococcus massiliensis]
MVGFKLKPSHSDLEVQLINTRVQGDFYISHYLMKWMGESQNIDRLIVNLLPEGLGDISCVWKPLLSPNEGMTIGDMVFRSPIIVAKDQSNREWYLIPDISFTQKNKNLRQVMDLSVNPYSFYFGIADYRKEKHVYHKFTGENFWVEKNSDIASFYLVKGPKSIQRSLSNAEIILSSLFAQEKFTPTKELTEYPFEQFERYSVSWANDSWNNLLWNEFEDENGIFGGTSFIVTGYQSPNNKKKSEWREPKSIWNQAWFSDVRVAYGLFLYGNKTNNEKLIIRSQQMINLALRAPMKDGLFPSVFKKSKEGWIWTNSNRGPGDATLNYHLADMSWTCIWLIKYYQDCEQNPQILNYVLKYCNKLLTYQSDNGSFPAWVNSKDGTILSELSESAETGIHSWLLLLVNRLNTNDYFYKSAVKGLNFISNQVMPEGRWEDFELYWSCSHEWGMKQEGVVESRSGMYYQNNLSMYWSAMAFIEAYKVKPMQQLLDNLKSIVAEISLYQAIWDPPYLPISVKGGFGVMNSDDEWNDARQSLFAVMYYQMYELTLDKNYLYRGVWALKASFNMMFAPENDKVCKIYKKMFPFFNENDYGFEMENAFHGEHTLSFLGEFSIYSWGSGGAVTSYEELERNLKREGIINVR